MIRWRIDPVGERGGKLTLTDINTGIVFMMVVSDMAAMQRFLGELSAGAERVAGCVRCPAGHCTLEGMSAFVKAFPEMF
jgi:hypothetical protein